MFNANQGLLIKTKSITSEKWGEICISIYQVSSEQHGEYYEIRNHYDFEVFGGTKETHFGEVAQGENALDEITEVFNSYDKEYSEYSASCAFTAGQIHLTNPKAIPLL